MDTLQQDPLPTPDPTTETPGVPEMAPSALSRRGFLRTAALTGGGLAAVAGLAACAPCRDRCRLDVRTSVQPRAECPGSRRERRGQRGSQRRPVTGSEP